MRFFVRSKSYTFLEPLGYCKNLSILPNFFCGNFVDFQDQNIMNSGSMVSQKVTFPKCDTYISRKIIQYWSFFTKRFGFLLLLFSVRRTGMNNDDVITYSLSKMKLSKMWHIISQSKDNSVLISFYWKNWVSIALVLELGGLDWKMMT